MKKEINFELKKMTGTVTPLGALRTKKNPVIGEFTSLVELVPFCKNAGLEIVQLLPVNDSGTQISPYSALSAFALNPIYISISEIDQFKNLYTTDVDFALQYDSFIRKYSLPFSKKINRFDYSGIYFSKVELLKKIFLFEFSESESFEDENADEEIDRSFNEWIEKNPWVKSYSVFKVLKEKYLQASWKTWSDDDKKAQIEKRWKSDNFETRKNQLFYAWCQFIAFSQFQRASGVLKKAGIILKGDIPILMNEDSCDAWEHGSIFNHSLRAGNPPDGENPCGQNWGFPTYNWEQLKNKDYVWWKDRLELASQFYEAYRLDHILGFYRIWAVPEKDSSAVLGHTEPYVPFTRLELENIGFDKRRIHWLSEPHIPTAIIEDITWNHEKAHQILQIVANRLGNEELWNFKESFSGDNDIFSADFKEFCDGDAEERIKKVLSQYWRDRCLIQLKKDSFVPAWLYKDSTSWKSLNGDEQGRLQKLFAEKEELQNELWKKNAQEILQTLTSSVKMIPCGEDLGVSLACVPSVMKQCGILGLRVVRWSREWGKSGQPYIPFEKYTPLSITTTSVHDSSTLRQWWEDEVKGGVFSPEKALALFEDDATTASVWCIYPLQDFLYLEKKYYLEKSTNERINVPGTVTDFNWTYMLPSFVENLAEDKSLCKKINCICKIHKGGYL